MSCVYFHSLDGESRLRGSERHHFAGFCHDLLMASIGPIQDYPEGSHWGRRMFSEGHYMRSLASVPSARYADLFSTALKVGNDRLLVPGTTELTGFLLSLNTVLAVGNDAVRLGARIHGQSEIHCWIAASHRHWIADIIEQGLASGYYRASQNWAAVLVHLRDSGFHNVVLSYSVCEQFPNRTLTGLSEEEWVALSDEQRWEQSFAVLTEEPSLQITPDRWAWKDYYFTPRITGFDLERLMNS